MRLPCPCCGLRDAAEFTYRGDASLQRPADDAGEAAFSAYVYLRDNPAGTIRELWYHRAGCGMWLEVTRNTRSHEISGARLAREATAERAS
ncbi:sarcosine oxidase, delta subunit family [Hartmannibacter diazotrophicus]|uniref:Sarcosine oxidase, delta subunit family n=1 Tax=Hartmannibacter diazotrophicus TaxID=1482074 RepID=A0A2C9D9D4_9HYPH|nr:sarcosine oxidase subunit delta [Hartmannibacter diazotrophicus]SON56944.1 sarcosine oxidase, delta subunit family [Hartmannibacter diazotrophicus]